MYVYMHAYVCVCVCVCMCVHVCVCMHKLITSYSQLAYWLVYIKVVYQCLLNLHYNNAFTDGALATSCGSPFQVVTTLINFEYSFFKSLVNFRATHQTVFLLGPENVKSFPIFSTFYYSVKYFKSLYNSLLNFS